RPYTTFNSSSLLMATPAVALEANSVTSVIESAVAEGIRFTCGATRLETLETEMQDYLQSLGVRPDLVIKKVDREHGTAVYTLATPKGDTNTLNFHQRLGFAVGREVVALPTKTGRTRKVTTVSKKEILLALMQHGRLTEFRGSACDIKALHDHIGARQNIVAWAEHLGWVWPNGDSARWNRRFWNEGTPKPGTALTAALMDAFLTQRQYAIGCFTATKLVIAHGITDYYGRVKPDTALARLVQDRLLADGDALVRVEPARMWSFEADFDRADAATPGKLLLLTEGVAPKNFVPGDWAYLLNTDPVSYRKMGYEGSNAIYLGHNRFDDYYNDNHHAYTYEQKLDEVYQWRHGVFSRSRDFKKIRKLSHPELERLGAAPDAGGLVHAVIHIFDRS
ncbi:hypothetical protein, partial [Cupriavidus sp. SK-3]|uniref:hypothetical protein n=1 Tax=Cupriavidus sp. SK-3 TaxID=1470558 RepID=UPI00055F5420